MRELCDILIVEEYAARVIIAIAEDIAAEGAFALS
jgi:hypothetical protein